MLDLVRVDEVQRVHGPPAHQQEERKVAPPVVQLSHALAPPQGWPPPRAYGTAAPSLSPRRAACTQAEADGKPGGADVLWGHGSAVCECGWVLHTSGLCTKR